MMSPCKETNDVTGHDRGRSLNLFVGCSIDDVRQCGRPSESNCCLLRARDAGSSYVGIEASGLSLASHRRFCPQFPASSHETSGIISARGGRGRAGRSHICLLLVFVSRHGEARCTKFSTSAFISLLEAQRKVFGSMPDSL